MTLRILGMFPTTVTFKKFAKLRQVQNSRSHQSWTRIQLDHLVDEMIRIMMICQIFLIIKRFEVFSLNSLININFRTTHQWTKVEVLTPEICLVKQGLLVLQFWEICLFCLIYKYQVPLQNFIFTHKFVLSVYNFLNLTFIFKVNLHQHTVRRNQSTQTSMPMQRQSLRPICLAMSPMPRGKLRNLS